MVMFPYKLKQCGEKSHSDLFSFFFLQSENKYTTLTFLFSPHHKLLKYIFTQDSNKFQTRSS